MIISKDNKKIKEVLRLKSKSVKKSDVFLIDGYKEIKMAEESSYVLETIFFCEKYSKGEEKNFNSDLLLEVNERVFDKISFKENPDGFLAVAKKKEHGLDNFKIGNNAFIVALESIEKPGNLGAILRTCDGAGVEAIFLIDPVVNLYNPNVVRASLGTIFSNNIITCDREEAISFFRDNKVCIFASTPDANDNYTNFDYKKPCAVLVGTEHEGLSKEIINKADKKVSIPMIGKADSLNASVSAALLIYEIVRQRRKID